MPVSAQTSGRVRPDEVDERQRPPGGLVEAGERALDVRERLGRVDGPGRALGNGTQGGAFHRGRG